MRLQAKLITQISCALYLVSIESSISLIDIGYLPYQYGITVALNKTLPVGFFCDTVYSVLRRVVTDFDIMNILILHRN